MSTVKKANGVAPTLVSIVPINGNHSRRKTIVASLKGNATYAPAGGSGGWQIVDRPKRVAANKGLDRAPWSLTLELIIDDEAKHHQRHMGEFENNGQHYKNIEHACSILESWMDAIPNTLEPPVFSVSGPVPGVQHLWCLYSLEFGEALRHPKKGFRYQQQIKMVFYEYNPPAGSLSTTLANGHVETYKYNASTGTFSFQTHVVSANESLNKIANEYRISLKRLQDINNIRDPRNIAPGQTIIIPNS